jgi:alpha-galactosidase
MKMHTRFIGFRSGLLLSAIFAVCSVVSSAMDINFKPAAVEHRPFHDWAKSPPMGWNSWDCFGTTVTEEQTKQNADYMAEKLLQHGWNLITVDIQWYEPNATGHDYKPGAPLTMDEFGRLLPATNKFPSAKEGAGFKPLADHVHGKGLTFGIHLMRGIPRQAVEKNLPVKGTNVRARDIANTKDTCSWNPDMYGVDMSKPGAQAYYDSVFELIASWDVDFVKVDDLSRPYLEHQPEIEAIRKAIDKTGRKMVLSTSPGETALAAADHVAVHANMWRTSDDFWDSWKLLKDQFARARNWAPYAGPGHWPDHDMLALGAIRMTTRNPGTNFTQDEQLTHMTLWAIARSPLIFGGHLPKNDEWTLSLLTNDDVIAVNQRGENARELFDRDGLIAWVSDAAGAKDKYVALFNTRDRTSAREDDAARISVDLQSLGFERATVRDLWTGQDLGEVNGTFTATIRHHGAKLFRLTPR